MTIIEDLMLYPVIKIMYIFQLCISKKEKDHLKL